MEFDFCWPDQLIAIEVQGGINSRSRRSGHVSVEGMHRDIYKLALAQASGWILFQMPPIWVTCDSHWQQVFLPLLKQAIKLRKRQHGHQPQNG
jgi:hypothetical protein